MILNTNPENSAVLSNVSSTNEFRIRNSSKAFSILSSGLYANKIKAIIRELSCNAYDSHVAAGKPDEPFTVHLPNRLEPWFSVRDFGVGLSHDEVINIYTTYFESTKTASNDFVGALGLGSKSPFSYTENFTVTAIKGGKKGIYSAFVNDSGVPSIALMSESATNEGPGVEIRFSVEDFNDIVKFQSEAVAVYTWFKTQPIVTGYSGYDAALKSGSISYTEKDIVPGIHRITSMSRYSYQQYPSYAVMGNIAYPIEVPNPQQNLGSLADLLKYGLVIEFNIGEIDFQASREGLSYIPQTIAAIKAKLENLQAKMYDLFLEKVKGVDKNKWVFAGWLIKESQDSFWGHYAVKYAKDYPSPLYNYNVSTYNYANNLYYTNLSLPNEKLEAFNIKPTLIFRNYGKPKEVNNFNTNQTNLNFNSMHFFLNDTNKGAIQRIKKHVKNLPVSSTQYYIILDKIDKSKEMQTDAFFDMIHNPPEDLIHKVSDTQENTTSKKSRNNDVTILRLSYNGKSRNSYNIKLGDYYTWKESGKLSTFLNSTGTFYYIPLSGFVPITKKITDFKETVCLLNDTKLFSKDIYEVYGVRKADLEEVEKLPNWVNVEDHIEVIFKKNKSKILDESCSVVVDTMPVLVYNEIICKALPDNSDFKILNQKMKSTSSKYDIKRIAEVLTNYDPEFLKELTQYQNALRNECKAVLNKYPLLQHLNNYLPPESNNRIAEYINLIDKKEEN
jgi:hypothetical protein